VRFFANVFSVILHVIALDVGGFIQTSPILNHLSGNCDTCFRAAAPNEVHVLFHCQDLLPSQKEVLIPFLPFLPILFYGGPLYSTCLA